MLPRVGAALAQFISPIASSGGQEPLVRQREERSFQRFKQPQKPETESESESEAESGSETTAKVVPLHPPPAGSSVTQAVLQLMSALSQQRLSLMRWLGSRTYQSTARAQKKAGRFRKGTILDQKAE